MAHTACSCLCSHSAKTITVRNVHATLLKVVLGAIQDCIYVTIKEDVCLLDGVTESLTHTSMC